MGTSSHNGVDLSWIPQETLNQISTYDVTSCSHALPLWSHRLVCLLLSPVLLSLHTTWIAASLQFSFGSVDVLEVFNLGRGFFISQQKHESLGFMISVWNSHINFIKHHRANWSVDVEQVLSSDVRVWMIRNSFIDEAELMLLKPHCAWTLTTSLFSPPSSLSCFPVFSAESQRWGSCVCVDLLR